MIIWCYSFIDLPVYFRIRVCRPFHVQLFLSSDGWGSIIYFNLSIVFGLLLVTLTGNPFDLTSIDSIGFPRWVERKDFEYFSSDHCFFKIKKTCFMKSFGSVMVILWWTEAFLHRTMPLFLCWRWPLTLHTDGTMFHSKFYSGNCSDPKVC